LTIGLGINKLPGTVLEAVRMSTLVVTRKIGEAVRIGDDIKVTLIRAKRDGAYRLVIEAPRCVKILREEIYSGAAK
jgi:carbon storage regulator CsrA